MVVYWSTNPYQTIADASNRRSSESSNKLAYYCRVASEEDESQMDETDIPQRLSDEQARDLLEQICDCRDSAQFQHLPIDRQRTIVAQAATQGAAINQLARITGLSYRQVYKTVKKEITISQREGK